MNKLFSNSGIRFSAWACGLILSSMVSTSALADVVISCFSYQHDTDPAHIKDCRDKCAMPEKGSPTVLACKSTCNFFCTASPDSVSIQSCDDRCDQIFVYGGLRVATPETAYLVSDLLDAAAGVPVAGSPGAPGVIGGINPVGGGGGGIPPINPRPQPVIPAEPSPSGDTGPTTSPGTPPIYRPIDIGVGEPPVGTPGVSPTLPAVPTPGYISALNCAGLIALRGTLEALISSLPLDSKLAEEYGLALLAVDEALSGCI